jgi:hypothetical protein
VERDCGEESCVRNTCTLAFGCRAHRLHECYIAGAMETAASAPCKPTLIPAASDALLLKRR